MNNLVLFDASLSYYGLGKAKGIHYPSFENTGWIPETFSRFEEILSITKGQYYSNSNAKINNLSINSHGVYLPNDKAYGINVGGESGNNYGRKNFSQSTTAVHTLNELGKYMEAGSNIVFSQCYVGRDHQLASLITQALGKYNPNINIFFNTGATPSFGKNINGDYRFSIELGKEFRVRNDKSLWIRINTGDPSKIHYFNTLQYIKNGFLIK